MADYIKNENPTPVTGVVGTILGATALAGITGILGNGGLGGIFGNNSQAMAIELAKKDSTIALLEAGAQTDKKLVDVYSTLRANEKELAARIGAVEGRVLAIETAMPLREQIVLGQVNSVAQSLASNTSSLQASIASIQSCLSGITQCKVRNDAVCPGWGNVTVTPSTTATTAAVSG